MYIKIALIQNKPGNNKLENLNEVEKKIPDEDFNLLVLPESFNSPYGVKFFKKYAENLKIGGPTLLFLKKLSLKYKDTYIVGGSIPEEKDNKYYNTCTVWNNGTMIAVYRKIHLFDVSFPDANNFVFKESDILSNGEKPVFFNTPWGNIGLGICFDLRFNKLSNYYRDNDCKLICYPGNFTEWSGKLHWKLLLKARALDNQCFIVGCSTALNIDADYKSYGHSMVVNPWGDVFVEFDNLINSCVHTINMKEIEKIKYYLPLKNIL